MSKIIFDIRARTSSWEFIIQSRLTRLPVDPLKLCTSLGIFKISYHQYAGRIGKPIAYIAEKYSPNAFCLFYEGKYYIVCNENLSDQLRLNCIIAHELAHIVLGHIGPELPYLSLARYADRQPQELQADKFAGRLQCPSIVLHLCGIASPEELAAVCAVTPEIATERWDHLQVIRRLKRFFVVPQERVVMNQFAVFIANYVADKFSKDDIL